MDSARMRAIEFEASCKDGMITVPKEYIADIGKSLLRVILLQSESDDLFYSESNMEHLRKVKADADAGLNMHFHELIGE